jgi:flagellar hook assembly protein FlgD
MKRIATYIAIALLSTASTSAASGTFDNGRTQVENASYQLRGSIGSFASAAIAPAAKMAAPQATPADFNLAQNFPNPFNPSTTIAYALPQESSVRLTIYNIVGQQIRTLVDDAQTAGSYKIQWDARDDSGQQVATGFYIYRLEAGSFSAVHKMTLVK